MKSVDLFCGAGGLSAGLKQAGIQVVEAYDNWLQAITTYCNNLGGNAKVLDVSDVRCTVDHISNYKPDLIAGSPPCQDFSTAGKRKEGERANLTLSFAQIVSICLPKIVLMENVPQVRLSNTYGNARSILKKCGYKFAELVLDASYFQIPQSRKRFIMLAWLNNEASPKKFKEYLLQNTSPKKMTIKEYLGDEINIEYYYRHARNYSRRAIFSVFEPSPTIRGVNRPVPPNYRQNHLDSAPPTLVRPLTSFERSRIQTFPAHWNWGSDIRDRNANVEQLIGNAVPLKLAKVIGKGIIYANSV